MRLIGQRGKSMSWRNLLETVLSAIFVVAASSAAALGQDDPADCRLHSGNGEDSPPSSSATMTDPSPCAGCCDGDWCRSCCGPRWTASADFIILDRVSGGNQMLVARVPAGEDPLHTAGTEALNSKDFQQGFSAGPKLDLIGHGDSDCDLELSYFQIDGWSSDRSVEPDNPVDWLVMRSPGFIQTNQPPFDKESMDWSYATKLYNAELNVRWNPSDRITVLAGFRWVNLGEYLMGELEPPTISWEQPFWRTWTTNNLYGLQIGADGKLFERGRFSIDGLAKAGLFDNNAQQTTAISVIFKQVRTVSASANHGAFVGETGLRCKYQLTEGLSLRAGYEVIWLEGVALAPGQIQETSTDMTAITAQALGVNCGSGVLFHGATAGLEYSF
jgi:hypothetical protein